MLSQQSMTSSIEKELASQLERWTTVDINEIKMEKDQWLDFLCNWSKVLQLLPNEAQFYYEHFSEVLNIILSSPEITSILGDIDIAQQSLSICILQLDQSHIKDVFRLTKIEQTKLENQTYLAHIRHILFIISQSLKSLSFMNNDIQQLITTHTELIIIFREYLDRTMVECSTNLCFQNYYLHDHTQYILIILSMLANHPSIIPILLKCSLAKSIIKCMDSATIFSDDDQKILLNVLYSIACFDDGANELNGLDCIPTIKQYQKKKIETDNKYHPTTDMILMLLWTCPQSEYDVNEMNMKLIHLYQMMTCAAGDGHFHYDDIHISELLKVLAAVFSKQTDALDYVLCHHDEAKPQWNIISNIHQFIHLFNSFKDAFNSTDRMEHTALISILSILWNISYQVHYKQELLSDDEFVRNINALFIDENTRVNYIQCQFNSSERILQSIHGILHNLNLHKDSETICQESFVSNQSNRKNRLWKSNDDLLSNFIHENSRSEKPWIMISYCHHDNTFCSHILEYFSKRSDIFNIWIDRIYCQTSSDVWASIAEGIERSSVIVCLLSNKYFQSKSCRHEFIYATDSLKKPLVPVLLENFEPKGWLGLKYFRFRDVTQPDLAKFTEVLNAILLHLTSLNIEKYNRYLANKRHESRINDRSFNNLTGTHLPLYTHKNWSIEDIQNWFTQHHVSAELRDLFNFQTVQEILDYARLLMKNREKQMHIYAKVYSQKYDGQEMAPHDFIRFASAVELLFKYNQLFTSSTRPKSSTAKQKKNVCIVS